MQWRGRRGDWLGDDDAALGDKAASGRAGRVHEGFPVAAGGPGSDYTFDFDDPEGNRLQFYSDMDQIGWDGKSRPKDQWKRFTVED